MKCRSDVTPLKSVFSASAARTGVGEGPEQQRATSLYLTTISFGMGQGK